MLFSRGQVWRNVKRRGDCLFVLWLLYSRILYVWILYVLYRLFVWYLDAASATHNFASNEYEIVEVNLNTGGIIMHHLDPGMNDS